MKPVLFYFSPPLYSLPWSHNAQAADAHLDKILEEELAAGVTQFYTVLKSDGDLAFARRILALRARCRTVKLLVRMPYDYQDEWNDLRAEFAAQADGWEVPPESRQRDMDELRNFGVLFDRAGIFVSPLEPPPRPPVSVLLSRMALERKLRLAYYDDRGISRPVYNRVIADES